MAAASDDPPSTHPIMTDATIERHRTPPPHDPTMTSCGYVKASNQSATVIVPVALSLLDDPKLERYIHDRVLPFLDIETRRIAGE